MLRLSDDVLNEFIQLFESDREVRFAIGDRLIELVEQHNDDKEGVIHYLAGTLNVTAGVLYEYYRISERWTQEDRDRWQFLDWTVYRNADPVADRELLDKAVDEGWSASRFKEEKYPALKEPSRVLRTIMSMLQKMKRSTFFMPTLEKQVNEIIEKIELILAEEDDDQEGDFFDERITADRG